MRLTCLPILNMCKSREENTMVERKMRSFKWNHFPAWFYYSMVFFLFESVFFLLMVLIKTFIRTLCFYDFWKTVLVKKIHTLPRCGLISPPKCHIFYTGFKAVLYLHNWSPLKPQNKLQKKSRALPLSSCRGLCALTLQLQNHILKKCPPSQLVFAVRNPLKA